MAHAEETVQLPSGVVLDGVRHRRAVVRPLTGADETQLLEASALLSPAQQATLVLERCVSQLDPFRFVTREVVRRLTVGDREALLLHVRRLTLGDRLQCTLECAHPECGEAMDLDLRVSQLLLPPYEDIQEWYDAAYEDDGRSHCVRFRLPCGEDQEAAAAISCQGRDQGAALILERCVRRDDDESAVVWSRTLVDHVAQQMTERDPQAELIIDVNCVECGRPLRTLFDAATFLLREMALRIRHVYREVHLLAYHYHWSEAEIMAMTAVKRHRYLSLLDEQMSMGRRL